MKDLIKIICEARGLIVLCGMSGTGKTTFANKMMESLNYKGIPCKYFAIDDYKDKNYKKYGFNNKNERLIIRDLAISEFKVDVMKETRKKESNIIIDYPFEREWQQYFDFLITNNPFYRLIIVNFNIKDDEHFNMIWERRVKRDLSAQRSNSLIASTYIVDSHEEKFIIDDGKFSDDNKNRLMMKYKKGSFNSITGDFILSSEEIVKLFGIEQ